MKQKQSPLLIAAALLLLFQFSAVADPSKNTAVHVKAHALALKGKDVSLDVAYVKPLNKVESEKYSFVIARTWDDRGKVSGGEILVVVPKDELEDTLNRYGISPDIEEKGRAKRDIDTHRLTGILKATPKKRFFVDATGSDVDGATLPPLPDDGDAKRGDIPGRPGTPKKPDDKPGKKTGKKPGKGKK